MKTYDRPVYGYIKDFPGYIKEKLVSGEYTPLPSSENLENFGYITIELPEWQTNQWADGNNYAYWLVGLSNKHPRTLWKSFGNYEKLLDGVEKYRSKWEKQKK